MPGFVILWLCSLLLENAWRYTQDTSKQATFYLLQDVLLHIARPNKINIRKRVRHICVRVARQIIFTPPHVFIRTASKCLSDWFDSRFCANYFSRWLASSGYSCRPTYFLLIVHFTHRTSFQSHTTVAKQKFHDILTIFHNSKKKN